MENSAVYLIELRDGVRVRLGDRVVTRFRTQKAARLLAFLALHPGNHSRERLIELFWPELDLSSGRNSLSGSLGYLRRPLEQDFHHPEGTLIFANRNSVGLVPGSFTTDLESLPPGFDVERILPGLFDDWVLTTRERLARARPGELAERARLPAMWTTYLGREELLNQVPELFLRSRLVTLVGPGGVGKTRLALESLKACEVRNEVVCWVDLATLRDPSLIPERIAGALGLPGAGALLSALRTQKVVLTLDNCEHVILDAARWADRLLRACPAVSILATSREPLAIAGETILRLPGLSESESAALFCERARRADPDWRLPEDERPLLSQLCQRLDGLPLALELAAARLRTLSLPELVLKLDSRLATLSGNLRLGEPRQQTLEMSIAWSFDLLSESERALFLSLSVFHGAWSAAQATALWGDDSITDQLDALLDKSLLQSEPSPDGRRYRFLETIREFARARFNALPEADRTRWQAAHFEYFYNLLLTVPRRYSPDAAIRSQEIRHEQDNFLPALEVCRAHAPERALIFCWHLSTFWDWFGQSTLAREQLKLTLPLPECQPLDDDRRIALDELYYACMYTRDWEGAEWAIEASDIATAHPHQYRLFLSEIKTEQRDLDLALRLLQHNLKDFRREGSREFCAQSLFRMFHVHLMKGDVPAALDAFREAERNEERLELSPASRAASLRARSLALRLQGEHAQAREVLLQAVEPNKSHHSIAYDLIHFAHQSLCEGDLSEAARLYGASIAWCERHGFDLRGYNYFFRERDLALLRERLGPSEFERGYSLGYNEDPDRILSYLFER